MSEFNKRTTIKFKNGDFLTLNNVSADVAENLEVSLSGADLHYIDRNEILYVLTEELPNSSKTKGKSVRL